MPWFGFRSYRVQNSNSDFIQGKSPLQIGAISHYSLIVRPDYMRLPTFLAEDRHVIVEQGLDLILRFVAPSQTTSFHLLPHFFFSLRRIQDAILC